MLVSLVFPGKSLFFLLYYKLYGKMIDVRVVAWKGVKEEVEQFQKDFRIPGSIQTYDPHNAN